MLEISIRKRTVLLAALFFFFFYSALIAIAPVDAASVGFVPATGIWFSRVNFAPQDSIRVYSVVINNEYNLFEAVVSFYDHGALIDTAEIKNLAKDSAQEIHIFWQPGVGEHVVSARFTKAIITDATGARRPIDLVQLNTVAGSPFILGGAAADTSNPKSAISTSTDVASSSSNSFFKTGSVIASDGPVFPIALPAAVSAVSGVKFVVSPSGANRLIITEPRPTEKTVIQSTSYAGSRAATTSSISSGSVLDPRSTADHFVENRKALVKEDQLVATITSTAKKINDTYFTTQSIVDRSKTWWGQAQQYIALASSSLAAVAPGWATLSDNNNPLRVGLIVGGVIIVLWILKRMLFRSRYD